jgi:hypothetical protein
VEGVQDHQAHEAKGTNNTRPPAGRHVRILLQCTLEARSHRNCALRRSLEVIKVSDQPTALTLKMWNTCQNTHDWQVYWQWLGKSIRNILIAVNMFYNKSLLLLILAYLKVANVDVLAAFATHWIRGA